MKTSTGFASGGATAADVALMRRVVGAEMGVKAAGGVRDLEGLKAMVAAGATRVGASAGVKIVQEVEGTEAGRPDLRRHPATDQSAGRRARSRRGSPRTVTTRSGNGSVDAFRVERLLDPPPELAADVPLLQRHRLDPHLQLTIDQSRNASTPSTSIGSRMHGP